MSPRVVRLAFLLTVFLTALAPAAAQAAVTASVSGGVLTVDGGGNAAMAEDQIGITCSGTTCTVSNPDGVTGDPAQNCSAASPSVCTGVTSNLVVNGGGDEDTVTITGTLPNPNTVNGEDGDDVLQGGTSADLFDGGAGFDRVLYGDRGANVPVTVTMGDGLANDGATGEGDNVNSNVENLTGGDGNDTLTGTSGISNSLVGAGGDDTLDGGREVDGTIDGLEGSSGGETNGDTVSYASRTAPVSVYLENQSGGEAGETDLVLGVENARGGSGDDNLRGRSNGTTAEITNRLEGNAGNDTLDGGFGNDALFGGTNDGAPRGHRLLRPARERGDRRPHGGHRRPGR